MQQADKGGRRWVMSPGRHAQKGWPSGHPFCLRLPLRKTSCASEGDCLRARRYLT
jgi:hypothetical protein